MGIRRITRTTLSGLNHDKGEPVRTFVAELWRKLQAVRWDGLRESGWEITGPVHYRHHVGVKIHRGKFAAEFSVPKSMNIREMNAMLLSQCEYFAVMAEAYE